MLTNEGGMTYGAAAEDSRSTPSREDVVAPE
jgi:hypothetical protein